MTQAVWKERFGGRALWGKLAGAAVVLTAFVACTPACLLRPGYVLTDRENVQIAEAQAWWQGRIDLPERKWDTALFRGRVYSHFPPMFTVLAAPLVPLFGGIPRWLLLAALAVPVVLAAYVLLLRRTGSPGWGAVLAIGLICGTSLLPVTDRTLRGAAPYFVNQTLAVLGVLIVLLESFGKRRVWLAGLGLTLAALSRQLTILYTIPLLLLAWQGPRARRTFRLAAAAVFPLVVVLVSCSLNALKFGNPLDSGYMHVYTGRAADDFSRDGKRFGLFSVHYVPRNLYYANLGFPDVHRLTIAGERQVLLRPNTTGTGIWWTTPVLLWLLLALRPIITDAMGRAWLIAAALLFTGLLFYHSTGTQQRGFNRYSLDYVPVLFALMAPYCTTGRRRWVTAMMVCWSVLYFRFAPGWPYLRIW